MPVLVDFLGGLRAVPCRIIESNFDELAETLPARPKLPRLTLIEEKALALEVQWFMAIPSLDFSLTRGRSSNALSGVSDKDNLTE